MDKNIKKALGYILVAFIAVGLVIVIVGLFVGEVVTQIPPKNGGVEIKTIGLFDNDTWGQKSLVDNTTTPSNMFAIISFVVAIVGLVMLAVDAVLKMFLKKRIRYFGLIAACVAMLGGILVLISGLVAVNGWWKTLAEDSDNKYYLKRTGYNFFIGAGVWLGIIGGLVGGAAGIVGSLKAFY